VESRPKAKKSSDFQRTATAGHAAAPSESEHKSCPIVAIGASAGGLEAFTGLLKHLPIDTGLGFVLVQHLDPQHESALTQLLARATAMSVREVTNNLRVRANHIYVIPPNCCMAIAKGVLKLRPREGGRAPNHSIDFFFESVAQDQRERAIGIILSGTASDGTLGLEAIKAEGGITFAQDESARYDSMPRSAVAAGCVDFVLSPENIAKEVARIARHPYMAGRALTSEWEKETAQNGDAEGTPAPESKPARSAAKATSGKVGENGFKKILTLLRNHSGVDFSLYKPATIERRITRRMVLNKQNTPVGYADFLKGNAKELEALYSDVLISVTSFFRNPEAFEALKLKVFPRLLQQHRNDPIRVWTLGCSTGQEAYSIAIAFTEFTENIPRAPKLQIFATDLNDPLLEKARHGLYAKSLAADVSPERLRRFFVEEQGGYRVCKPLRELCVFARQNVLSDPPFSRMDLISCRNLLIYIEPDLQKKILPNFHYALKPGGFLLLGASESIGASTNLFEPADKKQKLFSKKQGSLPAYHLPVSQRLRAEKKGMAAVNLGPDPDTVRLELTAQREADRLAVTRFSPPGVLINSDLQILQFRGPTGAYLEPPTGKASFDLLKMARNGLMLPLRAAFNKAKKENKPARRENIRMEQNGREVTVNLEVVPLKNLRERCFLILFENGPKAAINRPGAPVGGPSPGTEKRPSPAGKKDESRRIVTLERELSETRDYLQSIQQQHEAAHEELQASNEEVQSANEELQSINEELETSKEELESTNEELTTVNEEMGNRNTELYRVNNDLNNLHASINTPILLLGRDLTIRRFTTLAEKIFNLLPGDVGRPLSGIRHNLDFPGLEKLLAEVIDTVSVREQEVQDKEGRWYVLRARPYLTVDNKIDGAVLLLLDIDSLKQTQREITEARKYAESVIEIVSPLLILDEGLRVVAANESFHQHFHLSQAETANRLVYELDHGRWNMPELRKLLEDILPRNSFFDNFEVTHEFGGVGRRTLLLRAQRVDHIQRILVSIQDITERLQLEGNVRRSELRYRRLFEAAKDGIIILDPLTRKITDANPFIVEFLGYGKGQILGKELWEIGLLKDEEASREAFRELKAKGFIRYDNLPLKSQTGQAREVEFVSNVYQEAGSEVVQCNIRDISERKRAQRETAEKARLLDLSNDAIMVRGFDEKLTLWNKGAEKLYGWTAEEAIGKEPHSLLKTEFPKPREEIAAQLQRDGHFSGEVVQVARDGRRVPSLCRWILDPKTESILTSYTDMSERKRAEEALRQSYAELQLHTEELERFNGVAVGRELRMLELKKEINDLCGRMSEAPRYVVDLEQDGKAIKRE
jgi:two-component system CheB/CheR fusion protein